MYSCMAWPADKNGPLSSLRCCGWHHFPNYLQVGDDDAQKLHKMCAFFGKSISTKKGILFEKYLDGGLLP